MSLNLMRSMTSMLHQSPRVNGTCWSIGNSVMTRLEPTATVFHNNRIPLLHSFLPSQNHYKTTTTTPNNINNNWMIGSLSSFGTGSCLSSNTPSSCTNTSVHDMKDPFYSMMNYLYPRDNKVDIFNTISRVFQMMNRNARRARRANHGKRPVSNVARRAKRRAFGNHRR